RESWLLRAVVETALDDPGADQRVAEQYPLQIVLRHDPGSTHSGAEHDLHASKKFGAVASPEGSDALPDRRRRHGNGRNCVHVTPQQAKVVAAARIAMRPALDLLPHTRSRPRPSLVWTGRRSCADSAAVQRYPD